MRVKPQDTYIERPEYFKDRVAIVRHVDKNNVHVWYWNLSTFRLNTSRVALDKFMRRFQKSWLQMRVQKGRIKRKVELNET